MTHKNHPTQQELRRLYLYNADGSFTALTSSRRWKAGRVVSGSPTSTGYMAVTVGGLVFLLHRLIWIWHNGDIPVGLLVEHENEDKSNCRIGNLRLATHSQNHQNTSGRKGYSWAKEKKKWRAEITTNGKCTRLGYFDLEGDAREAYVTAKRKLHGDFAPMDIRL